MVPAADVGSEVTGVFVEQLLELLLWKRQGVQRRIGQPGEVKMHPSEREAGSRDRAGAGCLEAVEQPSLAQQLQDLPAETAGFRGAPAPWLPFQDQRPDTGKAQLGGQQETGRAGTHDDHIGVLHAHLSRSSMLPDMIVRTCSVMRSNGQSHQATARSRSMSASL